MSPRIIPTRKVSLAREFKTRTARFAAGGDVRAVPVPLIAPQFSISAVTPSPAPPAMKFAFGREELTIRKIGFSKPVMPKIRKVQIQQRKSVEGHKVRIESARKIETSYSAMIDGKPVTLEMFDLKHVPYPEISEIIRTLAEKNDVSYSQVKLIGIFAPIPTELIRSTHIDPFAGKLMLNLKRRAKKGKPRCVRIAFGRLRTNDKIVQCVLPLN
ncbi:MAG: hypothetical protein ABIH66_03730 [bacterium]